MEGGELRMSNTIDTRVVEMKFDNAAFERGVASTLKSLGLLEKGLQLKGAANGLNEVQKAAGRFSLGNMAQNVENIASKFSTMGVVGVTALASIAHQAIATGAQLLKSVTTEPIMAGLREYETNLNSIQTILANTGLEGKAGLTKVTGALDELNHYSDQTIYNFSEMAKNIGTFTAAGIKLEPATAAIKGIANLAAISGSNSEQASAAMYQLSQAMAAGKATLVDWNSVVNAGMGGKVFQNALIETARVQGVAVDDIIKKNGSFRDSLQEGWLTTEVLSETLSKFTGDLSAAQLKSMGYNEKQIAGIMKMGKTAQDAATKVKTVSQLINTLQEAASSGWAKTWQLVFGDFDEAKTLFTNVNTVLGGFISRSADARNKVLGDWKALGGRKVLIEGIAIAFNNVMEVLHPLKLAFRDIFPAVTAKQLMALTVAFRDFMAGARLGEDTMENLRRTFRGVFAIFSIGISLLKGLGTIIKTVLGNFSGGSGGILEFTGNIGDWLVALDKAIKKGEGFRQFFVKIGNAISIPIGFLQNLIGLLADATGVLSEFVAQGASGLAANFNPLQSLGEKISAAWSGAIGILKSVFQVFEPLAARFVEFFSGFGDMVAEGTGGLDWNSILASINTGLFAALVLMFKRFLSNGIDFGGGFMEGLKDSLNGLTGVLTGMQQNLKAQALMKLAAAIALLAVSVKILSTIDPKRLTSAMAGLTVMFGQMLGAMAVLDAVTSTTGFIKMPFLTASMIMLAIAIDLLAVAVAKMAKLNWEELARGLIGVGVLLGSLALFTKFATVSKGAIGSSASLILLAVAIGMLVDTVKEMADTNWGEMAQGLIGIAGLLVSLAIFTKLSAANKGGLAQGAGLILVALAIKILASAIKDIGQLSWGEIAKGMAAMAVGLGLIGTALALIPATSLLSAASVVLVAFAFTKIAYAVLIVVKSLDQLANVVKKIGAMSWGEIAKGLTLMAVSIGLIGAALYLLPKTAIFSAAAVYVVAQALVLIAKAMGTMGGMSWGEIAKSLVMLAGSLGIIAAALYLMTAAIPGALAVVIIAGALRLLAPVLVTLGGMKWSEIAKGLAALAGIFLVLGVAGLLLAPVVPVLISLGLAITLLGVGMLAAGAGMLLFSAGLTASAVAGTAAAGALVASLKIILDAMPGLAVQFTAALIAFAKAITKGGPAIIEAMVTVINSLMSAIDRTAPKVIATLGRLLVQMLAAAVKYVPKMTDAGIQIMIGMLDGIARNAPKMVTAAANVIIKFLEGIKKDQPRVVQAGVDLVIGFVNSVAESIRNNSAAMGAAGANLGTAIVEGMARGIGAGIGVVTNKAKEIAGSALKAAMNVLGVKSPSKEFYKIGQYVVQGFVNGMDGDKASINNAFYGLRAQLADFRREAAKDIGELTLKLKELNKARTKDRAAIRETTHALNLARAEYAKTNTAYTILTKKYLDDTIVLGKLADKYDVYTAKINRAKQALADLTKTRDDYAKSIADQYSDLATPADGQSVAEFIAAGKKQLADTKAYAALLQKLRKLGLNDEAYKDLLAKGPAGMAFAQELLGVGKSGIVQINKISSDLDKWGASLGKVAAANLYQAGINAAAGLVKGLQKSQGLIEKQMDAIAAAMLKAIKKALGIKSPSREFMEIAKFSLQGMALGMEKYGSEVDDSAKRVGENAIATLRRTMSGISDVVTTDANFNPTIRPVLDLTGVKSDATRIAGLLRATPLKVDAASDQAKNAAAGYSNNKTVEQENESVKGETNFEFTQINNSPKPLSNAEIYRQTRNQLSIAKGALTGSAN